MQTRDILSAILLVLYVSAFSASGFASASSDVQTYATDLGDVSIEIPCKLEPTGSSGTALQLAKPGMVKPVLSIILQDTWGDDLETYAAGMVGEDKTFTEMTTDDGHRMLFCTTDAGLDREGKPIYRYYAFIDYLTDKDVVVEIFGYSKTVLNGDVIASFDENTFKNICRSFAFVS